MSTTPEKPKAAPRRVNLGNAIAFGKPEPPEAALKAPSKRRRISQSKAATGEGNGVDAADEGGQAVEGDDVADQSLELIGEEETWVQISGDDCDVRF